MRAIMFWFYVSSQISFGKYFIRKLCSVRISTEPVLVSNVHCLMFLNKISLLCLVFNFGASSLEKNDVEERQDRVEAGRHN